MPRVLLGKELNMANYFTTWIKHKKTDCNVSNQILGEVLGITSQAFGYKLKNNQYTFEDFIKLTKYFQATDEELIKLTRV